MKWSDRRAGILLHPTSLPKGVIGVDAYQFIDFLAESGFTLWQVLPLGPTHSDLSPYQTLSISAGNPDLIDWHYAVSRHWLDEQDLNTEASQLKHIAYARFLKNAHADDKKKFTRFRKTHTAWLDDYALFMAIKEDQQFKGWTDWPKALRDRDSEALENAREAHKQTVDAHCFEQFLFYCQWLGIKEYAHKKGVMLFGDLPIFVAHDSVDVWVHRHIFQLDEYGQPVVVAGVPPDYFSKTGQRWGNPLYDWDVLKQQGYDWWLQRIKAQMELFDVVRIDHFRGFEAYWEVGAKEKTAINGQWKPGPGADFFSMLQTHFGEELPLVAEDLGMITEEVHALREQFQLPGMKILQFAFGGESDNIYLPHNHEKNCVVYTGTHDNNTSLGWWKESAKHIKEHVRKYFGSDEEIPALLIRAALASVANTAIIPLQDLLGLDERHRMNIPGTQRDNWRWRFQWEQFDNVSAPHWLELNRMFARV